MEAGTTQKSIREAAASPQRLLRHKKRSVEAIELSPPHVRLSNTAQRSMNFGDILKIKKYCTASYQLAQIICPQNLFLSLILKVYPYKKEMFTSWSLENS